jgi:hypothetical protein
MTVYATTDFRFLINLLRKGYLAFAAELGVHNSHLSDIEIFLQLLKVKKDDPRASFVSFMYHGHDQIIYMPEDKSVRILFRDFRNDFFEKYPQFINTQFEARITSLEQQLAACQDKLSVLVELMENDNKLVE